MNVLFVCTGNTCRSCMAEAIFNSLEKDSVLKAFSAGVHVMPGSKTSKNSAEVAMKKLGADIKERQAVQLSYEHIEEADIVFTMTNIIKEVLVSIYPEYSKRIFTISEYAETGADITDPYGQSLYAYEKTYEELIKSIEIIIKKLKLKI